MALEAVVFPQDPFGYGNKDLYNLLGGNWGYDFGLSKEEEKVSPGFLENQTETLFHGEWNYASQIDEMHQRNYSSPEANFGNSSASSDVLQLDSSQTVPGTRQRRRRARTRKNQEEIENQRMTHITVERNRRKLMNDYLAVLRSLMPESYVQRGDQASIIGGAINFVKELEQRVHILGAHKETKGKAEGTPYPPFSEFFTFPQYSTSSRHSHRCEGSNETVMAENKSGIADIEVTLVESHANLKIRVKRRPKQLLRMVSGLQCLSLTILHLNVTTLDRFVLYSLCVKVEDDCKLGSVDEIATAVHEMLGRIQEEGF